MKCRWKARWLPSSALGPDGELGTIDDLTAIPDQTTDVNGNYLFADLPPGGYIVEVTDSSGASHDVLDAVAYNQTGDPDHFAAPASTVSPAEAGDHRSTDPVIIASGGCVPQCGFRLSTRYGAARQHRRHDLAGC